MYKLRQIDNSIKDYKTYQYMITFVESLNSNVVELSSEEVLFFIYNLLPFKPKIENEPQIPRI